MSKIWIIEDVSHRDSAQGLQKYYGNRGHIVQLGYWDDDGYVQGLRVDAFLNRHQPEVLIIHFSTFESIREAKVTLTRIKKSCPRTKIIVVTCINPIELISEVFTTQKPYDVDEISRLLMR